MSQHSVLIGFFVLPHNPQRGPVFRVDRLRFAFLLGDMRVFILSVVGLRESSDDESARASIVPLDAENANTIALEAWRQ